MSNSENNPRNKASVWQSIKVDLFFFTYCVKPSAHLEATVVALCGCYRQMPIDVFSTTSFYRGRLHLYFFFYFYFFYNVTTHCLALKTSPSFTFHTNPECTKHILSGAPASQRRTLTICGILFDAVRFKSCSLHARSKQWIRQVRLPLLLSRAGFIEEQQCFSCA